MKDDPRAPPFPIEGGYDNEMAALLLLVSWQAENIQIFIPFGDACYFDELIQLQRRCCGNARSKFLSPLEHLSSDPQSKNHCSRNFFLLIT
jgi:hypothetical protein